MSRFNLGIVYIVISYFMIVGFSNAVNLTDGLDGLAILPSVLVGGALGVIAYLAGHAEFSALSQHPPCFGLRRDFHLRRRVARRRAGFSLVQTPIPAQVFMGDIGALALGAALGVMAIISRHEIVLFIMGGVFVVETGFGHDPGRLVSSSPAGAFSAWRHCTTISSSKAGRNRG